MTSGEQFVAIDVGSAKIKAVIGEWDENRQLRILVACDKKGKIAFLAL